MWPGPQLATIASVSKDTSAITRSRLEEAGSGSARPNSEQMCRPMTGIVSRGLRKCTRQQVQFVPVGYSFVTLCKVSQCFAVSGTRPVTGSQDYLRTGRERTSDLVWEAQPACVCLSAPHMALIQDRAHPFSCEKFNQVQLGQISTLSRAVVVTGAWLQGIL